jgi:hypothetical protein
MNFTDWLTQGDSSHAPLDVTSVLLALCVAFLSGHALAWVYMLTHRGQAVPRPLVNTLVVMPVLVALVMLVLQDNLVTAFGMMGVFAIVRFRNVLADTHDTTYVLAAIMVGMAAGTQRFSIALIGAVTVVAILLYLHYTGLGHRVRHDTVLHLHWGRPSHELPELDALLTRYTRNAECTAHRARDNGGSDLSFRLLLRDPALLDRFLGEVRGVSGVSRLTSFRAEEQTENSSRA